MPNPGSQTVESTPYRRKRPKARTKINIPRGNVRRGLTGVIGGPSLRSRTKIAPYVGRNLRGGGAKPLPVSQRKLPRKPDAPTTEPRGFSEPRSRPYRAIRKRTKAKARGTY